MVKVKEILERIDYLQFIGEADQSIIEIIQLDVLNSRKDVLCWCSDKNLEELKKLKAGTIICSNKALKLINEDSECNYILVDNPRFVFASVLKEFFLSSSIEESAEK